MTETTKTESAAPLIGGDWIDPLEDGVRIRVRDFIETILEEELEAALGRGRYERKSEGAKGYRNGHRDRKIVGTFGPETVRVPRAWIAGADGQRDIVDPRAFGAPALAGRRSGRARIEADRAVQAGPISLFRQARLAVQAGPTRCSGRLSDRASRSPRA